MLPFITGLPSEAKDFSNNKKVCDDNNEQQNEHLKNLKESILDDDLLFWKNNWWKNIINGRGTVNDWERLGMYILL